MNKPTKQNPRHIGTVDHVDPTYAYIILQNQKSDDIIVHTSNLAGAIHQDTVEILIFPNNKKRKQGKVINILKRKYTTIIGNLHKDTHTYCLPDQKRLYPIIIPQKWQKNATPNDKVVVKLHQWSNTHKKYTGQILDILGKNGDYTTENKALTLQFGLDKPFDHTIQNHVNNLPNILPPQELNKRRNFSNIPTFTIDPETAKDFDDAISVQTLPNQHHQIGIHIADVTYYVQQDTPLDQEARKRSTSTYLVDKVIPMLPERLSNDLCSLRPQQTRPALSIVVTFNNTTIIDTWIGETLIHSDKRFTYDQAHNIIQQQQGPFASQLLLLDQLAKHLRQKRLENNAIAFGTDTTKIIFDNQKKTIDIKPIKSTTTHQLIEEFMLLANRLVAEKITKHHRKHQTKTPFIYRIHKNPKPDKLQQFYLFAKHLGYTINTKHKNPATTINTILAQSKGTIHENAIHTLAIRTMEQASYTTKPLPHFGLGFQSYTHFTSPIRRYPDIMVHRFIKHHINNTQPSQKNYEQIAQHSSQRERHATDAERASINLHQVIYMQQHIGKTFQGIISGVTKWGLYVEITQNKCEGLIRIADLTDDYYTFNPQKLHLKGSRNNRIYQLGDPITIKVKHCNLQRKNVDFALA